MDFLDHQFLQVVQHIGKRVFVGTPPCRHIVQDRLFAGVEFDDLRHERIHGLVVGDAGTRRVDYGDPPGAVNVEYARHAERRSRIEGQRIEKIVIDAPVHHINLHRLAGGAHVEPSVLHKQVVAGYQLHAHFISQESVFEKGGIVDARCQHDAGGLALTLGRRDGVQRLPEQFRIMLDGRDAVLGEQIRKQEHHRFAVFQHVGHARRCAAIVL